MSKSRRQQFKRHTNWHHVYPTSRFKIKKGPALHTAWHDVFENLTPEEAMGKAAGWAIDPEKFRENITANSRKMNAWTMLFGGINIPLKDVLEIIKNDWTFHGVRMIKTKRA